MNSQLNVFNKYLIFTIAYNRCNTKLMWDLWWGGKPTLGYAPYRRLSGRWDLTKKGDDNLLTKAAKVMNTIVGYSGSNNAAIQAMSSIDRDKCFEVGYITLFKCIYPSVDAEALDARRIGDRQYVTLYDLINKFNKSNTV